MSSNQPSKYLSTSEVCQRYRRTRWTILQWEKAGKLPAARRDLGRPMWCRNQLDRFDAERDGGLA